MSELNKIRDRDFEWIDLISHKHHQGHVANKIAKDRRHLLAIIDTLGATLEGVASDLPEKHISINGVKLSTSEDFTKLASKLIGVLEEV